MLNQVPFSSMKRNLYRALKDWKTSSRRKPLILRGVRQVGKTHLLKHFGRQEFPRVHYLNFEEDGRLEALFQPDLDPHRILNALQFILNTSITTQSDLVIFDEIQACPRALTSLKYFAENLPELALCAAGSLIGLTLSRDPFPVGKVNFLDLAPATFTEFLAAIGEPLLLEALQETQRTRSPLPEPAHARLWERWKWYLVTGGLPEIVVAFSHLKSNLWEAFREVRHRQRDLITAYLADMARHSGKSNALHLERLWRNVPVQLASLLNGSASRFRFKDAVPGFRGLRQLAGPLDWLETTGLVLRTTIVKQIAPPLAGYGAENRFKLYLFDVGILHALLNLPPEVILNYDFGTYKGYVAENFTAQELQAAGVSPLICWQGRTSEVDFLLETSRGIVPVEVKSGHVTQSKSLKIFMDKYTSAQSVVISARNFRFASQRMRIPVYAAGVILPQLITAP